MIFHKKIQKEKSKLKKAGKSLFTPTSLDFFKGITYGDGLLKQMEFKRKKKGFILGM